MVEFEAIQVVIDGKNATESGEYEIRAANADGKVREFSAGALNLNGFGFATAGTEIGEYGETVTIEQADGSRYLNLRVIPSEEAA